MADAVGVIVRYRRSMRFVAELLPPALQGRAESDGAYHYRERAQTDRQRGFLVQQVDDGVPSVCCVPGNCRRSDQVSFVVAVALDAQFHKNPGECTEIVFGIDDFGHHGRYR